MTHLIDKEKSIITKFLLIFLTISLLCLLIIPPPIAYALTIKEVLIFVGGALVGGAIYDGVKWSVSVAAGAITAGATASISVALAVMGLSLYGIFLTTGGDQVMYYLNDAGCVMAPGGHWNCPYKMPLSKI